MSMWSSGEETLQTAEVCQCILADEKVGEDKSVLM